MKQPTKTGIIVEDIEIGAVEIKNGTDDTRAVVSTAGGDAVSNTQNELESSSRISGFNGTTWDRIRTGITSVATSVLGYLNVIAVTIYRATPISRTDGQSGPIEGDGLGNVKTTQATNTAGEDIINDVMKVEQRFSYANMTTQTTTVIKGASGFLHSITFNKPLAAGVVTIYDNTAGSGTVIGTITFPATLLTDVGTYTYDVSFGTGLTIVTSGATQDITISYR